MASKRRFPHTRATTASWQVRAKGRLRGRRLATLILVAVIVAAGEWRGSALHRAPATFAPDGAGPDNLANSAPSEAAAPAEASASLDPGVLRADERAVALAPPLAPLPLATGDRVELVAIALDIDGHPVAEVIAPAVRVLSADNSSVVVAVPEHLSTEVLARQAGGLIELVLVPEPSSGG